MNGQGLIALLAVVDALSHVDGLKELNKQVGFFLCNNLYPQIVFC